MINLMIDETYICWSPFVGTESVNARYNQLYRA
jgi:hypothetical protein